MGILPMRASHPVKRFTKCRVSETPDTTARAGCPSHWGASSRHHSHRLGRNLLHPCFNSTPTSLTAEMISERGRLRQIFGVKVQEYLSPTLEMSSGIINQPQPHYFFHRPLSVIFSELFAAGFVIDGFEEPAFPPDTPAKNAFSWAKRPGIPPVVIIRARL
jgi:hypothetical protein